MSAPATLESVNKIPAEYFTPDAQALCKRVSHKSELSDKEVLMLAMVAAQAALARYWEPGDSIG